MYGRIHEPKLKTDQLHMSCQLIKNELETEIDVEHKRVNVDSAKKRAVLQSINSIQRNGLRQFPPNGPRSQSLHHQKQAS